jgi:hypothetical protein
MGEDAEMRVAHQTVMLGGKYPTRLVMPVVASH